MTIEHGLRVPMVGTPQDTGAYAKLVEETLIQLWPNTITKIVGKQGDKRHLFLQFEDPLTYEVHPSKL